MLSARTGSEQLISRRSDDKSYFAQRPGGVRRGTNWNAKLGIHAKVHWYSLMICSIDSGWITQLSGDCMTR